MRRYLLRASIALLLAAPALAQHEANNVAVSTVTRISEQFDAASQTSIEQLIGERIDKEWKFFNAKSQPELVKIEANYVRTAASSPMDILYEASFHLQPNYYSHNPTAPDTSRNVPHGQSVMYYVGSARTPFALPVVSNLSKALSGDEASYTINLGILPLPYAGHPDSIRYYVVIERAIESNHTDNTIRFERFQKEFASRADEPVPLRLTEEVPLKGAYILQMENGSVLDFYDDFARFISEHILINSERLKFKLGKQTISDISSRLSIPYSIARTSNVKVQLLSVVDTAQVRTIVDTLRQPADYLTEYDMSHYADGPYRYRLVATDATSGSVIYDTVAQFNKMTPVLVGMTNRLAIGDTLRVGGKKRDYAAELFAVTSQLERERVVNDRLSMTVEMESQRKKELQAIVDANKNGSIADIRARAGFGIGAAAGTNVFFGIESSKPALAMDVSFGYQYSAAPFLGVLPPTHITELSSSPNSLGIHLSWMPVQLFDGALQVVTSGAFYGTWTSDSTAARTTASLLSVEAGIGSEPWKGLGLSLTAGVYTGLGIAKAAQAEANFRTYVRF